MGRVCGGSSPGNPARSGPRHPRAKAGAAGAVGRLLALVLWATLWVLSQSAAAWGISAGPAVCGTDLDLPETQSDAHLRRFARSLGLEHVDAFVKLVRYLDARGRLPDCYLTKGQAERAGWSPGGRLWRVAPGAAIGGDRFGNRERRLPTQYNGRYREADLDFDGGERGPKRLVFVENQPRSGLIWVTTDHYRTFRQVQVPRP